MHLSSDLRDHAHRIPLGKLFYPQLFRGPNGIFEPLLGSGGGFTSETGGYAFVTATS
jgi:hypothetical protein